MATPSIIPISGLPVIPSSELTDVGPFVQNSTTYQASLSQILVLFNSNIVLANIDQVNGLAAALASFLMLSGGAMTGVINMDNNKIINVPTPTNPNDAVNKAYADTIASGFTVILAVLGATTANLNVIYNNGSSGVGATLTDNSGTFAAFTVDGLTPALNSRILVKNQTSTFQNGVYVLTINGNGTSIPYVLTRSTDYDTAAQIKPGTLVAVNAGAVNIDTSWLQTATVVTVGTDPILFSQFTFSPGEFLQVANNLSDVANVVTARNNLGLTAAATMTLPVSPENGGSGVNNAYTITLGGNLMTSGSFATLGDFTSIFNFTANTNVTFPTSGILLISAQPTINQPNIVGVTNGSNAVAGSVGEYISSTVLSSAGVVLATGVYNDITTITLTAGDWDVWGNIFVIAGAGYIFTNIVGWINTESVTSPDPSFTAQMSILSSPFGNGGFPVPQRRISIVSTTTIYLTGSANFSTSSARMFGGIYARRVR